MPQSDTDKPRRGFKTLGVLLAGVVAIASLALVAVTHEPKSAVSSPPPVNASMLPQMADTKSEAEILFRGKSFAMLKRPVNLEFAGEVAEIHIHEGDTVAAGDRLATYKLDRNSLLQVHNVLYPERVLALKTNLADQTTQLNKYRNSMLPIRKMTVDRTEKELSDLRELLAKGMTQREAVVNKERELHKAQKELLEVQESIKQVETDMQKTRDDLGYFEEKHKRDVDLLEWQTKRSFADTKLAQDVAFLKAPITGQVIWISPELRIKAEPPRGFHAMTVAPMDAMVVRCKVHELDLVKLKQGDRGTVTFDAIPDKKYPCKVNRIPWVSRNASLDVPADYDIECVLELPDDKVKDGLTCNVRVSIAQ